MRGFITLMRGFIDHESTLPPKRTLDLWPPIPSQFAVRSVVLVRGAADESWTMVWGLGFRI